MGRAARKAEASASSGDSGAVLVLAGSLTLIGSGVVLFGAVSVSDPGAADRAFRLIALLSAAAVLCAWGVAFAHVAKRKGTQVGKDDFESVPFPTIRFSRTGKAISANAAALATLGIRADRLGSVATMPAVASAIRGGDGMVRHDDQRTGRRYRTVHVPASDGGFRLVFLDVGGSRVETLENGEYLGLVANRLGAPLRAAEWLADMVADAGKTNVDQARRLSELKGALRSMSGSLERLELLARVESGTVRTSGWTTDAASSVKETFANLAEEAAGKGVALRTVMPEGLPRLAVDKRFFDAAIGEIAANAVRHNREGGEVHASAWSDGSRLEVRIADNGPGIPEKMREDVFRKFVRNDNLDASAVRGDGLGLYLARALVESSGGSVRFTSKEGEGSAFYVSFPLATEDGGDSGPALEIW